MTNHTFNLLEVATRIKGRLVEMGLTERAAGLRIGNADAIRNLTRAAREGRRYSPRADTLVKIAELLERSQAWLINGEEEPTLHVASRIASPSRPGRLDVYASAEGGEGGALILSSRPIGSIACPDGLEGVGDAYAVLFTGESMVPAIKPGQVGWVDPRLPPMRGEEHIFLSSRPDLGEGRAMVKDLVTWTETNWRVHQWNPKKSFDLPRKTWQRCHRLVGKLNRI